MRVILSIVVVVALGIYSVPYLVRDQVVIWLKGQGADNVTFQKVDINWFSGTVELLKLNANSKNQPPIAIGRLKVALDYPSLFDKRILVNQVLISDVTSGIHQQGDELWLGPVNLSQFSSEQTAEDPAGPPSEWKLGIANVSLNNINWSLNIPQHKQQLVIDNAGLNSLYQWDETASTHVTLNGLLNGSRVALNTAAVPLPEQKTSTIKLVLDRFPLQSVATAWVPQLKGFLTTSLELQLDLNGGSAQLLHSGSFSLDEFSWQDEQIKITDKHLEWSGKGTVKLASSALQNVSLDGALQSDDIKLEQGKQLALLMSQLNWTGGVELDFDGSELSNLKGPQKLSIKNLNFSQADLQMTAASLSQEGPLELSFAKNFPKQLNSQVKLNIGALGLKNPQVDLAAAQLSMASPLKMTWQEAELEGITANPVIALKNLQLSESGRLGVTLGSADFAAEMANISVTQPLVEKIRLKASALSVVTLKDPLQLAELDSLVLSNGLYSADKMSADQLTFTTLKTNYKQGQQPMSTIGEVQLKGFEFVDLTRLIITDVRVKDTKTYVSVTKNQGLKEVERLTQALASLDDKKQQQSKRGTSKASTQTTKKQATFTARVGQLLMAGKNLIYFEDHSVKPVFKSIVDIQQLKVQKIDTGKGALSPFALLASINDHAKLSASGKVNLLGGAKNGDWKVDLKNAELPVVSPYAGKYVGYFLQSGHMDFSSSGTLKAGVLSGQNRIKLNRLEVQPAQTDATDAFNQKLSMPLGTAISVLQDGDDNIKLDLPVEGSLDDPQFGYQDIVNRLATKGIKKAAFSFLTKALQPYGALISLASTAIDANRSGAFITLAPVNFAAGTTTVAADMGGYLDKIGEMMTSRKGLRLNVCGNAVKDDRTSLLPLLEKENKAKTKPLPPAELEVVMLERLQLLASARGEQVTNMLLDKGVTKERLFSCFPVPNLKNDELKPGVVLSL